MSVKSSSSEKPEKKLQHCKSLALWELWDLRPSCQVGFTNCMQTLILGLYNALYNVQPCVQQRICTSPICALYNETQYVCVRHPSVHCTKTQYTYMCTSPICGLYENTIHIYMCTSPICGGENPPGSDHQCSVSPSVFSLLLPPE